MGFQLVLSQPQRSLIGLHVRQQPAQVGCLLRQHATTLVQFDRLSVIAMFPRSDGMRPNFMNDRNAETPAATVDRTKRRSILPARLSSGYSRACLKRKALATTLTEESDMAAAAMIGDSRMPNAG